MRVRISLNLKDKKIPISYHSILQGVIYYAFSGYDNAKKIHDEGYKLGKRYFKLFTFSEIYGEATYIENEKMLLFKSNGCFDFTTFDEKLFLSFIDFLDNNSKIVLGKEVVDISEYKILDDSVNKDNEETFITISPITAYRTVEGKKTEYLNPENDDFKEYIISNLSKKYYLCFKENMKDIEITNIYNIKQKRIYFRNTLVVCYHMYITFNQLSSKVKKVILTCGLGGKNSYGLGMMNRKINEKKVLHI